jgi:D-alanyl-D-alanine carboxypeptidase
MNTNRAQPADKSPRREPGEPGALAVLAGFLLVSSSVAQTVLGTDAASPTCARLERARADYHLPGLTAAVGRADGSIVEYALGTSYDDETPIEPGALFLSGSIGKTYVAAIALDLQARGILDLDAPLTKLLGSESWFRALPNACCVTLRQMLNHSSGWPTHVDLPAFQRAISQRVQACAECLFTPLESIAFIAGMKPLFAPGQGFSYSETNYLVAGLAIEKASGRRYYDLLKERILSRLDLRQTVPSDHNVIPGLVAGRIEPHTNYFGLDAASTMRKGALLYNPGLEWTGGGLAVSSADLVRWGRALYTGRALAEPYLHDLFTSVPAKGEGGRYGLGVAIVKHGDLISYGHSGSIPGYRAALRYYPARDLAVAVQFNADPDSDEPILWRLQEIVLAAASESPAGSPSAPVTGIRCAADVGHSPS